MDENKFLRVAQRQYRSAGATAYQKGYIAYMFAAWPNSGIPEANPFEVGTSEHGEFNRGQAAAVLVAQDMDE